MLNEQQLEAFTDVMVRKAAFGHGFVDGRYQWQSGDETDAFRDMIRNVVLDTEMVVAGAVPLERWLEDS